MEKKAFENMCYEAYQLEWMLCHGYALKDLLEIFSGLAAEEVEENPISIPTDTKSVDAFADNLRDRFLTDCGFNGSLFVCKDEFLGAEFLDEEYMLNLFSLMPYSEEKAAEWRRITGIKKQDNPEIAKVLTLSTVHIRPETAEKLDKDIYNCEELSAIVAYPKIGLPLKVIQKSNAEEIERESYGWWVYIPQDDVSPDLHELVDLPEDLFACVKYANDHGCAWLCLDMDGGTVESLPVYDW